MNRFSVLLVFTVAFLGCGGDDAPPRPLDVSAGTYGGVGLGSSSGQVRAAFGEGESAPDGPAAPLGEEFSEIGGALSIPLPKNAVDETRDILRFEDVAFLVADDRVYAFIATAGGPVGAELESVRQAYPLRCGTTAGGDYREYPYCVGRLADRRYVWFGDDPVRSVTVSETSLLRGT
jgi:hypothetical protein